ncbi:MAG: translation elongation factor Ts [Bryobacteraceae bacterium]
MEITAALVKQLRDRTSAGMMECKSALKEANGDLAEAEIVLRKKGIANASKKDARSAKQGVISTYIKSGSQLGTIIEVNCESDFVARTDAFQELVKSLTEQIAETRPATPEALLDQPSSADKAMTVRDSIKATIAKLGEKISVARFELFDIAAGKAGVVSSYIHPGAQLGVLVELNCESDAVAKSDDFQELVRDIAMQIAASDPSFIRREEVTAAAMDQEKDIQRARALAEGKPEKMVDKIVEGRMNKYYEEFCLNEQPFIKDNTMTIQDLIKSKATKLGEKIAVARFARFKVGSTQTEETPAA